MIFRLFPVLFYFSDRDFGWYSTHNPRLFQAFFDRVWSNPLCTTQAEVTPLKMEVLLILIMCSSLKRFIVQ